MLGCGVGARCPREVAADDSAVERGSGSRRTGVAKMPRAIKIELDGSRYGRSSSQIQMQWEAEKEIAELLSEDGGMVVDDLYYDLMAVSVGSSVTLEYGARTEASGWSGASRRLRAEFDWTEGSDDLFAPGRERWRKAVAMFTWPEEMGATSRVLFRIVREGDMESLRRFRLTGDNGSGVVELLPKSREVKMAFECELSVERAIEALRFMGNEEFTWPRDRADRLRAVKRYMIRGEYAFEDAAPVVEEAVSRLATVNGVGTWRPKALEDQAFDVIDGALSALASGVNDPAGELLDGLASRGVGIGDVAHREE